MTAQSLPPGFIPSRHRENREQVRRLLGALYWLMPRDAEPSREVWREMGEALMHGDAPMDRLVEWMHLLRKDRQLAVALGTAARITAVDRFGIDRFVADWLGALSAVDRRTGPDRDRGWPAARGGGGGGGAPRGR